MKLRKTRPGGSRLAVVLGLSLLAAIAVLFRPSSLATQTMVAATTTSSISDKASVDVSRDFKDEILDQTDDDDDNTASTSPLFSSLQPAVEEADTEDHSQSKIDLQLEVADASLPKKSTPISSGGGNKDDKTNEKKQEKRAQNAEKALYSNDYDYVDPDSTSLSSSISQDDVSSAPKTPSTPLSGPLKEKEVSSSPRTSDTAAITTTPPQQPQQTAPAKLKIPRLSKQLATSYSRKNVIIVTWANLHFSDFVLNWVAHMNRHGIENYLVGAMDEETAKFLYDSGVENIFAMYEEDATDTGLTTDDFNWGSATFHKMGRQKVDLAATFTSFGLDLCLCDVDTVWINDPTEYFNSYPDADILASSDQLHPTQPPGDDGLEDWSAILSVMNIGLLFFRHSPRVTKFVEAWSDLLESDETIWDQDAFNRLAYGDGNVAQDDQNSRLAWGFNQTVTFGVLPVSSFASGHTYFVQQMYKTQNVKPYVVHTTFQFGGSAGKRHRLREGGLWQDPPEYYSQGQFLEVSVSKPEIPRDIAAYSGTALTRFHLRAMAAQLAEIRDAFGIAVALNRTLIMPKIYCFCDRYWGVQQNCRVPGSANFSMPFLCPLDHVMVPDQIYGRDDILTMGGVDFREYSFLENPRVPKSIKNNVVEIETNWGVDADEENESGADILIKTSLAVKEKKGADGKMKLVIPRKNTDVELKHMLLGGSDGRGRSAIEKVSLLRLLGSPSMIFTAFEDPETHRRFLRRFRQALDIWCCFKTPEDSLDPVHKYSSDFPVENDLDILSNGIVV